MAYDRYDTRDERSRWSNDRSDRGWRGEDRDSRGERGFFERAGDEIRSWFGDDDGDHRDRDFNRDRRFEQERGQRDFSGDRSSERDRDFDRDRDFERSRPRGYRPMTGDYGRREHADSEQFFAASGTPRGGFGNDERSRFERSQSPWGRDDYRRASFAGSGRDERDFDPHYRSWRERHMSELDRDYDDYRREHQSKFENDFGGWRERRQQKRGLLGQIREHMDVVGADDEHVGTVDKVAGDRLILTKSDPESGGVHHSLSCSEIDRIEGDRVILDCTAAEARNRWRDESRGRALFEREDQGEVGPRVLDRSFEGTYR